jgi:hypothetical protein
VCDTAPCAGMSLIRSQPLWCACHLVEDCGWGGEALHEQAVQARWIRARESTRSIALIVQIRGGIPIAFVSL